MNEDNNLLIDTHGLHEHMVAVEGYRANIYTCTAGVPTIGIGIALLVRNGGMWAFREGNLFQENGLFDRAGIDLPDNILEITNILNNTRRELNNNNPQAAARIIADNQETLDTFELSEEDSENVFELIQEEYETDLINRIANNANVNRQRAREIIESLSDNEQYAILSCVFNAPALIGPGVSTALRDYTEEGASEHDQAFHKTKAWYEIRYNSHRNGWRYINGQIDDNHNDAQGINGLANRRYVDSEMFGLYGLLTDDEDELADLDLSDDIREGILDFLEGNNGRGGNVTLDTIRTYEDQFSPTNRNQRYIDDILEDLQIDDEDALEEIIEEANAQGRLIDNVSLAFLERYNEEYGIESNSENPVYYNATKIIEKNDLLVFSLMDKLVVDMEKEEENARDKDDKLYASIKKFKNNCKETLEKVITDMGSYEKVAYIEENDRDLNNFDLKQRLMGVFEPKKFNTPNTDNSLAFFESFMTEDDCEKEKAQEEAEKEEQLKEEKEKTRQEEEEMNQMYAKEDQECKKEEEEKAKLRAGWIAIYENGSMVSKSRKDYYGA
ncbi:hypothetical protein [Natronospora cellulosivora (SeqCode)]